MNDDDITPETTDDGMPGDNVLKNEKALGTEARNAIRDAEKLFNQHDKLITRIHAAIVRVGEKLQVGRELYQFDNNGFNDWIVKNKLDHGRIFGAQQERTAAMTIYRLVVHGYETEEEGAIPEKLDLTNCHRARPTDIIKWAREQQPRLFDDLRNKMLRAKNLKGKKKPAAETDEDEDFREDDVGDLGIGEDQWVSDLKAELKAARARIAELEEEIASLRELLGDDKDGPSWSRPHGTKPLR